MDLSEYLRCSKATEDEVQLAAVAKRLAAEIMQENINSQGSKFPNSASMWKELMRRAEEYDKKKRQEAQNDAGSDTTKTG